MVKGVGNTEKYGGYAEYEPLLTWA